MRRSLLRVTHLGVSYAGRSVIRDLNLEILSGQCLAVMGPSGSGKSSLLGCVTGLLTPAEGEVRVVDTVINSLTANARAEVRRRHLGLLYQASDLLAELNVQENVALTMLFDGTPRAEALAAAGEALENVGLAGHGSKTIDQLSGGEAQRVALARALVRPQARVLVADEPTAALDADNARKMARLIVNRVRAVQGAALVATHDAAVAEFCDDIVDLRSAEFVP